MHGYLFSFKEKKSSALSTNKKTILSQQPAAGFA
jgi:hypothetical protein